MATAASELLRAIRSASLASGIAAAAASRAAAAAPRSSRTAALAASRSSRAAAAAASRAARLGLCVRYASARGAASTKPRDDASSGRSSEYFSNDYDYEHVPASEYFSNDYDDEHVPDDAKLPSDKDFESDEALWAFYERWCKAFNKERDHAEMARRFKIFKWNAEYVHGFNTYLPPDPEEAAIWVQKRREVQLLVSKGEDVSRYDECHLLYELGRFADGEIHLLLNPGSACWRKSKRGIRSMLLKMLHQGSFA